MGEREKKVHTDNLRVRWRSAHDTLGRIQNIVRGCEAKPDNEVVGQVGSDQLDLNFAMRLDNIDQREGRHG